MTHFDEPPPTVEKPKSASLWPWLVGALFLYAVLLSLAASVRDVTWAKESAPVGDYFGGIANAVALCGVVLAIFLQRRELEETRDVMSLQAELLRKQLHLQFSPRFRLLVSRGGNFLEFTMKNTGRGPGIVRAVAIKGSDFYLSLEAAIDHIEREYPGPWKHMWAAGNVAIYPGESVRFLTILKEDQSHLTSDDLFAFVSRLEDRLYGHVDVTWQDYFGVEYRNSGRLQISDDLIAQVSIQRDPDMPWRGTRRRESPEGEGS